MSFFTKYLNKFRTKKNTSVAHYFIIAIFLLFLISSFIVPLTPYSSNTNAILQSPSKAHFLGTDELGRDILSRIIIGTRNSIGISFSTVIISTLLAVLLTFICVSTHKIISTSIYVICDIILCVPVLIICLVIAASFGASAKIIFIGELVAFTPFIFRIAHKELLHVLQQEFSLVSQSLGMHPFIIAYKNGLPFLIPKLTAQAISLSAISIGIEGGLSYFGLGFKLPEPSLGMLLQESRNYISISPMYAISPLLIFFVFLGVLSFYNFKLQKNI